MSLHHLAQHIQSQGRGEDKMLVHMTPKEVQGLQALALASGGSLTINPHTGLPEAGWLSKLLPTIAGAALAPFTGGLSAAMIVGGASALASGSLKQGLMAGIGAYGGAGIMNSLAGAGGAAAQGATSAAANSATQSAALDAAKASVIGGGAAPSGVGLNAAAQGAGLDAAKAAAISGQTAARGAAGAVGAAPTVANSQLAAQGIPTTAGTSVAEASQGASAPANWFDRMNKKPEFANVEKGFDKYAAMDKPISSFIKDNKLVSAMAATPMLQEDRMKIEKDKGYIRPWEYTRQPIQSGDIGDNIPFNSTAERSYVTDSWTPGPIYKATDKPHMAAAGGIVALAMGGIGQPRASGAMTTTTVPVRQTKEDKWQKDYEANKYDFDRATGTFTKVTPIATGTDATGGTATGVPATPPAPTPANAIQIANMYNSMLRRPPTRAELDAGMSGSVTADALRSQLSGSDEYLNNLTKPFVPRLSYDQSGRAAIEGALTPYRSPAEQLGLDGFYAYMNQMLPQQAMRNTSYAVGGPVEQMSAANAVGDNSMYPQSQIQAPMYSNPSIQRPMPTNVITQGLDTPVDTYTGEQRLAGGGISNLGGYSDGGRLLKGPGDGVSDSIPAVIGNRQPARLADGEFVVPARIVSELGNGSTEAGARKLYAMMDRVQKNRRKSLGKDKVAVDSRADKHLPA